MGRLTAAQRLRRRLEDALRDRGLNETVSYSLHLAARARRAAPGRHAAAAAREPAQRGAEPAAPAAAARPPRRGAPTTRAHGRDEVALFESARTFRPVAAARRGSRGLARRGDARPRAPPPRLRCSRWAGPPAGAPRASPPTTTRHGRWWTRSSRRPACPGGRSPASRPFLHPGRQATVQGGDGEELGFIGELHPEVARRLGARGPGGGLRARSATRWPSSPARSATATATCRAIPRCARTSPWWCRTTCPPAGWTEAVRAGGGELLARPAGVRPLPRRAGGGGPQVARAAARVPRARPDPHRRRGGRAARGDRARARGARREAPCLRPPRAWPCWAPPASAARSAQRSWTATRRSSSRSVTARAEAGRRHDELYPRYGVRQVLEAFDADAWPSAPTPRSWPIRTRRRRGR